MMTLKELQGKGEVERDRPLRLREQELRVLSLLALLVQKYKY
jgi:hypothetical protein